LAASADKYWTIHSERRLAFIGTFYRALAKCLGNPREPSYMGKPSSYAFDEIYKNHFSDQDIEKVREKTIMLGDNLFTDVQFGKNAKISTALMLTGCTKLSNEIDVQHIKNVKPDYVLNTLSEIF
jgi:4-nitrophenyl phosphatase